MAAHKCRFTKLLCFAFIVEDDGRQSQWWRILLRFKVKHCMKSATKIKHHLLLLPAPGYPPIPWFTFSTPFKVFQLLNIQPWSSFSSHLVHLGQTVHGKFPFYKSICPPTLSAFHIQCTYIHLLPCDWKLQSFLCCSEKFPAMSLSLTRGLALDVENNPL